MTQSNLYISFLFIASLLVTACGSTSEETDSTTTQIDSAVQTSEIFLPKPILEISPDKFAAWQGSYLAPNKLILSIRVDPLSGRLISYYSDGTIEDLEFESEDEVIMAGGTASLYNDTIFVHVNGSSVDTTFIYPRISVKPDAPYIAKVDYSAFDDDNIMLDTVEAHKKRFNEYIGIVSYSEYSDHKYSMNYDHPVIDKNRKWEPTNISSGIQRVYFENSETVAIQRSIFENEVQFEIHFHPNGEIYSIKSFYLGMTSGPCKFVDLERYVILQGELRNGNIVGRWDNPVMANFDMQNVKLRNAYPGIIDQTLTLMNWYKLNRDERVWYMQ